MNTAFLLMAQDSRKPVIPVEDVCRDLFTHLTAEKRVRKISASETTIPLVRMEASQIGTDGVHLTDLAAYLGERREARLEDCLQLIRWLSAAVNDVRQEIESQNVVRTNVARAPIRRFTEPTSTVILLFGYPSTALPIAGWTAFASVMPMGKTNPTEDGHQRNSHNDRQHDSRQKTGRTKQNGRRIQHKVTAWHHDGDQERDFKIIPPFPWRLDTQASERSKRRRPSAFPAVVSIRQPCALVRSHNSSRSLLLDKAQVRSSVLG